MNPQKALIPDIREAASESPNLLAFIDALLERGIETVPRMKRSFGYYSIRFERDGLSLTRGKTGIELQGKLSYSVSRYDPILRYMEEARGRGEAQARILDEAGELALPVQTAEPPVYPSLAMTGAIQRIVTGDEDEIPGAMRALCAGYDGWSGLDESRLKEAIDEPILDEIEGLPEAHRRAALRWACRFQELDRAGYGLGSPQELALKRQLVLMEHSPQASLEKMENGPDL